MDKMSLAYMENALYNGASGYSANCPSFSNGYMANAYSYYPTFGSYYNQNDATRVANYNDLYSEAAQLEAQRKQGASNSSQTQPAVDPAAKAQLDKDLDTLADYALEVNAGHETFLGACTGGLTFAALENMQTVKHPLNSWRALNAANKIFDVKNNAGIKALWKAEPEIMQNAYSQVHAAYRRMEPKTKYFQQWFAKPLNAADKTYVNDLIKKLDLELKKGANANKELIMKYTEHLRAARGMDGYIPTAWNKVKQFFGANPNQARNFSASERVAKKANQINSAMKTLSVGTKIAKEFKGWFIFETAIEGLTKVIPTYMKGGMKSGNTQLLQSGVKAGASAAGWAVGRVVGSAVGAKVGAAIGSCICPGVGTAIGAIVGFAGGCVGSWLANKLVSKYVIPQDESTRLAKVEMLKTDKGKQSILALAAEKYQRGETPEKVNRALNSILASA